ncbi:hypothetical protein E2F50_10450 [Rhizobium deserti]|uniref:Uncharacterized protein n=1 Tax=Rhizobium deserti TaxID=2547961 RepID=A0A4R5UK89_9HYPH|nr:hypothetical protein [Rhizobium deserti]TDK37290.1 hypothetical protein E2F50_10450 [Rhizobium deserti]
MTPDDRIKRHEETIARLKEDVDWLRDTGFWTDVAPNANLIEEIERVIAIYISLIRELSIPPG